MAVCGKLLQSAGFPVQVYHSDGLDSVRAITDGAGNVIQGYQTDEFGNPSQTLGGVVQPLRFTGQLRDTETGFYDLRARMYDPVFAGLLAREVRYYWPLAPRCQEVHPPLPRHRRLTSMASRG